MNKFKILIPCVLMITLPWVHKIFYENLMLAWPSTAPGEAHAIVLAGSFFVWFIFAMVLDLP